MPSDCTKLTLEAVKIDDPPQQALTTLAEISFAPGTRRVFGPIDGGVHRAVFSPDGRFILSGSGRAVIELWDAQTGQLIRRFGQHVYSTSSIPPITAGLAFSPDGQTAFSVAGEDVILRDVQTGRQIKRIVLGQQLGLATAAFSAGRRLMVWGSWDGSVHLWDLESEQEIVQFNGRHSDKINSVAISPDGLIALSVSDDHTLKIWDTRTGQEMHKLEGAASTLGSMPGLRAVAMSPDGKTAASMSIDGIIQLWDITLGKEIRRIIANNIATGGLVFSPDGKQLAIGDSVGTIRVFDAETGQEIRRFIGHSNFIISLQYSSDGRHLVSGANEETMRQWNLSQGTGDTQLRGHTARVSSLAFTANGTQLLSSSWDGSLRFWDIETHDELRRIKPDIATLIGRSAISPDGQNILIATSAGIRLLDIKTGQEQLHLENPYGGYLSVGWSSDGQIAYGGLSQSGRGAREGGMQLWEAGTGIELGRLFDIGMDSVVFASAISPDSRIAAVGMTHQGVPQGVEGALSLWDVQLQEKIRDVRVFNTGVFILNLSFSPDGQKLAAAAMDSVVHLVDVETGKKIRAFQGHTGPVLSVAFSPDGSRVLSGSNDNTARLWDASTGEELQRFEADSAIWSVTFDPSSRFAVLGTESGKIYLWPLTAAATDLVTWTRQNRYVRELTCVERQRYSVEPLCDSDGKVPTPIAPPSTLTPTPESNFNDAGSLLPSNEEANVVNDLWAGLAQVWSFKAKAGERVTLVLKSDDFDPYLLLKSETGELLAVNDDAHLGSNDALIRDFVIPQTGSYNVIVDRFCASFCSNTEQGPFTLSIQSAGNTVDDVPQLLKQNLGRFGLSWERQVDSGYARLTGVVIDSPADRAGLLTGDIVLSLNGHDTRDLSERDVWNMLRGPVGLPLTWTVARADGAKEIPVVAAAQASGDLRPANQRMLELGQPTTSSLDSGEAETWQFEGEAGQTVALIMGGSEAPASYMTLQAPNGSVLAENGNLPDEEAGWLIWRWNAVFPRIILPETGVYTLTTKSQSKPAGAAPYKLMVYELKDMGPIRSGEEVENVLPATAGQFWTFTGKAGQIVTMHLKQHAGLLEPILFLAGPEGTVLTLTGVDQLDKFTAEYHSTRSPEVAIVGFPLPTTGEYTLVVSPFIRQNPISSRFAGTYTLSFALTDLDPVGNLTLGQAVEGELPVGGVVYYTYQGHGGEHLKITLDAEKPASQAVSEGYQKVISLGLLDTRIVIRGPNFAIIEDSDDVGSEKTTNSRIDQVTLPADGIYIIEVRSYRNLTGGNYKLLVSTP